MQQISFLTTRRIITALACVVIIKTTAAVVWGVRDYFPPNFDSDFLRGREPYFFGWYRWAFYTHIICGPLSLLNGLFLLNDGARQRFPPAHRIAGKMQVLCVLFVALSGLWMSLHTATGAVAGVGFAALAVVSGHCVIRGWACAVSRKFAAHRRWMQRCYVLLSSAVVLRLIGGLGTVVGLEAEWLYSLAAWTSWLLPLGALEFWWRVRRPQLPGRWRQAESINDQSRQATS